VLGLKSRGKRVREDIIIKKIKKKIKKRIGGDIEKRVEGRGRD